MADELPEDISTEDERTTARRFLDWTWDVVRTWGPALFIVLFIRSVIAEPFRIPSGSMVPTLQIGDHILVTKYSYGWRIPLTRIYLSEPELPERGDVVVFVKPGTDGGQYFDQNLTLSPHVDPYYRHFDSTKWQTIKRLILLLGPAVPSIFYTRLCQTRHRPARGYRGGGPARPLHLRKSQWANPDSIACHRWWA